MSPPSMATRGRFRLALPPLSSSFHNEPATLSRRVVWPSGANEKLLGFGAKCNAISKQPLQEVFLDNKFFIKWHEIVDDEAKMDDALEVTQTNDKIKEGVDTIKSMLESMEDGEINASPYDTAWVALIEDVHGNGSPQFPSSLEWIAKNQLPDGSWGDDRIFVAHERLFNTLACVVALKSWNVHPEKCQKGILFLEQNISKLEHDNDAHVPVGFEVAFPTLLKIARDLNIELFTNSPIIQQINAKRDRKLARIPMEMLHKVPTALLHFLEGMEGLEWEKLLKLQCKDGSFLFSPSSTAYAFMQTKDENCLRYLTKTVQRFNGGVPIAYPIDLFEQAWAVDRLQRLGISRYFQPQITDCVNHLKRFWTEKGIGWARNTVVEDLDCTCMAFRLLRLHGHQVSPDAFQNFKIGNEFVCFAGQSNEGVTVMYNFYRASHVAFPGEKILDDAKRFANTFLRGKQAANEIFDKWIIAKDLPSEVKYALDVPWHASLPRVEARFYVEQYGGEDDVWIAKALYKLFNVSNNTYLEVAKQDYNNCQALHRSEWETIQKWYKKWEIGDFGVSRETLLLAYFLATANIFEPERSTERLAWAKTAVLIEAISSHSNQEATTSDQRKAFVHEFLNRAEKLENGHVNTRESDRNKMGKGLFKLLPGTLHHLAFDALVAHGQYIGHRLHHAWKNWLVKWQEEGGKHGGEAELLVNTIILSGGHSISEEVWSHPQFVSLMTLTNSICYQLRLYQNQKVQENGSFKSNGECFTTPEIELEMQELVKMVLEDSMDGIDPKIKNTFLTVAKSFYYTAYLPSHLCPCKQSAVSESRLIDE